MPEIFIGRHICQLEHFLRNGERERERERESVGERRKRERQWRVREYLDGERGWGVE